MAIDAAVSRKTIFLRAASAITTVMHSMTSEDAKEQKAACGRKKSPAYAGKKTISGRRPLDCSQKPLSNSPQGRALKNYHYFHFIGVVRRHYRAFTRRSVYDVW
ncbi:MAG: hypothetical protein UC300_02680, partial [Prevotella sp.]|nr:hypothetical protein [Prevotella sp.]